MTTFSSLVYQNTNGGEEMAGSAGNSNNSAQSTSYADHDCRISKENLYMVLALHMQEFPGEPRIGDYKKVGAVLVSPNEMLYAVDYSRDGVHGVARLLMAHPETARDCKVFVSRKPCSFCTKLLVQSKVKRVFYLPIEPEYWRENDFVAETSRVDNLFKVSSIGQSVFVPRVGQEVTDTFKRKKETRKKKTDTKTLQTEIDKKTKELQGKIMRKYWRKDRWIKIAQSKLPWPAFDVKMKAQVHKDFQSVAKWMAHVLIESEIGDSFEALTRKKSKSFDPCRNDLERRQAIHLMKLAFFLAERTDDPRKGVGAVIINRDKDIVGLGWNGFPTKSLYGEFPRAADKDLPVGCRDDKKYPYIVHAEQNALLLRNTNNIVDLTLIVTMTPCDECTPLIEMQGIETVVLGEKRREDGSRPQMKFTKFPQSSLVCFQPVTQIQKKRTADSGGTGGKADSSSEKTKGPGVKRLRY